MIDLYEEDFNCWKLSLITNIYEDIIKMRKFKQILNLSQQEISIFKLNKLYKIASGSKTRLNLIHNLLLENNIESKLEPND